MHASGAALCVQHVQGAYVQRLGVVYLKCVTAESVLWG